MALPWTAVGLATAGTIAWLVDSGGQPTHGGVGGPGERAAIQDAATVEL